MAEARRAKAILDAQCTGGQASADFCRNARDVHGDLAKRLAASAGTAAAPVASATTSGREAAAAAASGVIGPRIFRAQVAARRDRQAAERELEELRREHPELLAGIPARIVRADLGERGVWHRIQVGEFASSSQGEALCAALSRLGREGCWVIATRPGDP